jgi:hypothetical protein
MTTNSRLIVGPGRLRASVALVTALALLTACSGSGDPGASDTSTAPTSQRATTTVSEPITTDVPPATDAPTTTLAPVPEIPAIEDTMADPSEVLFLGQQQRGLLPAGPDDNPTQGNSPDRPFSPCSFAWNRGIPSGATGNDYAYLGIDACEFTTATDAAAYAEAWRVALSTPASDSDVIAAIAPSGDWDGVSITSPPDDDDGRPSVSIERVRQYGLRVFHVQAYHKALTPDPTVWSDALVALQDSRFAEIGLKPDTIGLGFTDQSARFTVDDVLLPWAALSAPELGGAATWDSSYVIESPGDDNFATESGFREAISSEGSFTAISATRFDTPGDAGRFFIALRDRYGSAPGGGPIDGLADSVLYGSNLNAAVVHGDRLYVGLNLSGQIAPLMIQLDEHLRNLGLADGLTTDFALPQPANDIDLADDAEELATLFPPSVATARDEQSPQGTRVLSVRALDWSTEPNTTTQRYGSSALGIDITVVADVAQDRFASRFQPAGSEVVDGWTVSVVGTLGERTRSPEGQSIPPAEQVQYRRAKWFGTFGVVVTDAAAFPSLVEADTQLGGRRGEMLAGLDEWFADVEIPSFLTGTPSVAERLAMTRLCDTVSIDGLDRSITNLGGSTVNLDEIELVQRPRIGGVLRAAGPSEPTGAELVCVNEIEATGETPTGLRVEGIQFDTPEAAQAWLVATVGQATPETLVGSLTATFADDGTTTTTALTSGRYGFVVDTTLAGAVDDVPIDRNAFGRSVAAGLADRVALSGLV